MVEEVPKNEINRRREAKEYLNVLGLRIEKEFMEQ
jgi:hypothetical protein